MADRKPLSEREITEHHRDVKQVADQVRADRKTLDQARDRALDRADRREWANRKFGTEKRWRE